jgi:DNA-directed RNA polymerase subunit beta'
MRGLMAKPSGEIIETPITANFREGLTVLQYFISTHGARKGLADTALKTADSGYLTRRLVDVAQDVIVSTLDCSTLDGIYVTSIIEGGEIIEPLRDRIVGRVSLENVKDPLTGETILGVNEEITESLAADIQAAGIEQVKIRSVLTCKAKRGVCVKCYGRNLATGQMVDLGEATGVIAAQSIGEPGTQLTMRTFHIGGTASRTHEQSTEEAKNEGLVKFLNIQTVTNRDGNLVVMNRNGTLIIADEGGREKERYSVAYGAILKVKEGQRIKPGQVLVEWDPYSFAILTEFGGTVVFKDIHDGITVKEERDENTGLVRQVITESPDEKYQPQISIKTDKGKIIKSYLLPSKAHLWVDNAEDVYPGSILAKIPRETRKTKDITGGLPRIVELFEARKPKETAVITEIDGIVRYAGLVRGQRKIEVHNDSGIVKEYLLPRGVHINVQEGEYVRAGEALMDGPRNPHDILRVLGEKELQSYLVNEIQEVYRLQGVNINDKHIEVIVRQMMRWIKVEEVGDTEFLLEEQVDKFRFYEENERVENLDGQPAKGRPLLLGITKASLSTDSFISAASFQETTRVLTEAAISGKVDYLRGLKENVIMGRLIPAGTGMEYYHNVKLTEEIVPMEAPEREGDLEADLMSGSLDLDAIKSKEADLR